VRAPLLVRCTGPTLATAATAAEAVTVDTAARTVSGLLVPYGPVGQTSQGRLRFSQGSLSWSDAKRVKLLVEHDQRLSVGYATELTDTPEGLRGTFHVPAGELGDQVLAEASDGRRDGLSVGVQLDDATATRLRRANGTAVDARGTLREVSSVSVPAFDSARVDAVAANTTDLVVSGWHDEPHPNQEGNAMPCSLCGQNHAPGVACPSPAPATAAAPTTTATTAAPATGQAVDTTAGAALTPTPAAPAVAPTPAPVLAVAGAAFHVASEPSTYTFDGMGPSLVVDAYQARMHGDGEAAERLARYNAELTTGNPSSVMALAAVTTTADVTGDGFLAPTTFRPDLFRAAIDRARPITSRIGTTPIRNAQPFTIPVEGEFSGVDDHVEGTAHVPEGTLTGGEETLTPKAASGAYRVSRELVDQSNPAIDRIALRAMVRDYRRHTEGKVVAALVAAAGAGVPNINTFREVRAQLAAMVGDDDLPADELFASQTFLAALLDETATDGRPMLQTSGTPGAVARAGYTGAVIDNTELVRAGSVPAASAFAVQNEDVLIVESPTQTFRFDEVEGPGIIKLALWGYFGAAVLDAAGVVRLNLGA
jgi:HK97 family phage prohead protease/HK97 family phage major capsid protein